MYSLFLDEPADQGLTQEYMQSVSFIQGYAAWIEGQPATGQPHADTVLTTCKQHAMQWFDTIYPDYLNLPSKISTAGVQIDNGLDMLIQLGDQLKNNNIPAIRQSIAQYASSLQRTLQNEESFIDSVATSLNQFQRNIMTDKSLIYQAISTLTQDFDNQNVRLCQLSGQLQSLQNATCPDNNAISSCQQLIQSVKNQITSIRQAASIVHQAGDQADQVMSSAAYLSSFWNGIKNSLQGSVQGLQNMQNDPADTLSLVLAQNRENWNNLKTELGQIAQQIQTNQYINK